MSQARAWTGPGWVLLGAFGNAKTFLGNVAKGLKPASSEGPQKWFLHRAR